MIQDRSQILRLGTRGSLLARAQSQLIGDSLEVNHPGLCVQLHIFKTTGDQIVDRPLHDFGGKGLFTRELEQSLLAGEIDFAVHSYKDVPVTMPLLDASALVTAATPKRESPLDVLVSLKASRLGDLPPAARVGTGSLRRRCQLLAARPDLLVEPIRGNIDTRLRKLREGEYDAIILAAAGLHRAGLFDPNCMWPMNDLLEMLPSPGQGALSLQCRCDDLRTRAMLGALDHSPTTACVAAERHLVALLQGDCHSPIAALAEIGDDGIELRLRAAVGARDGCPPVLRAQAVAVASAPHAAAQAVFNLLARAGALELLAETGSSPLPGAGDP